MPRTDLTYPAFSGERLLLIVTGALSAAFLPGWLSWLRAGYPALEIRPVVTRSAQRFITLDALSTLCGQPAMSDEWPAHVTKGAPHVELSLWPDTVLVYPAGLHFLARLALGLGDTPAILALQCTPAPIGIAPSLPPHGLTSPAYLGHKRLLDQRPNIVIASPKAGFSVSTGQMDASVAAPMPVLLGLVERLRHEMSPSSRPGITESP
ncbi:phosphopantothenoylcysteine synthetase/decarboxylase [Nonomuraea thailandensis]|uniref:Phosphopantothenoylcysteine synthetase/decarboxylase n=1 Tax=Nonomuraea thailandensis TaxID=1188745 RepID=A0A9X2H1M6_9ACTN|nr:flavoprotein [Nonomuraea thailandensis]MCP2365731.1 phosphopantothenoylcysteine synthetase/decarboxylase [Nonomuraea thailandensis]